MMLLASSGPANARYLSVGTTTALIKLCAPVSTLHVSDRSISGAFMLEHLILYRENDVICFPTHVPGLMPFYVMTLQSKPDIIISADVPPAGLECLPAGCIS